MKRLLSWFLIVIMNQDKSLYTRQIDNRIFDQDMGFPSFVDLTPNLKNSRYLEPERENLPSLSSQNETQTVGLPELLKKIQFLENNFQWILECLKKIVKDHNEQHDKLLKKIQAVKQGEEQTQILVERQDQMVQIFQRKINQLQKIIKEQEIKLIYAQSVLNRPNI